jgi:uncharacterized protein (DUF2336 family)
MPSDSLIDELERALSTGSEAQRLEMLTRMTDLFVADANRLSTEQINLFDELLTKFVAVIEAQARARLSNRLAAVSNAPAGVIRTLAFDDDINVARPVLRNSPQIEESDLVANASTKSQQHLLAITERKELTEAVTDVLVARGDPQVVQSVAKNAKARFSFAGFRVLVRRAGGDDDLAALVGSRADLPRQQLLHLLDAASATVRARLLAQNPDSDGVVQNVLDEVDGSIRSEISKGSFNYAAARPKVETLHRAGQLNEMAIAQFAREHRFEETAVGLSLLCQVTIDVVERALLAPSSEVLLILIKIAGFSWATAKTVLMLKASDRGMSPHDLEAALASFSRLNVGTARKVLGFYNMRSAGLTAAS